MAIAFKFIMFISGQYLQVRFESEQRRDSTRSAPRQAETPKSLDALGAQTMAGFTGWLHGGAAAVTARAYVRTCNADKLSKNDVSAAIYLKRDSTRASCRAGLGSQRKSAGALGEERVRKASPS